MLDLVTRSSKSIPSRQNETARKVIREILQARFDGNQLAMARACGVSQSTISNIIAGKHGLGPKVMLALIRMNPSEAMRAMGIELTDTGYPLGEAASDAVDELERDGYSSAVAAWAVVTALKFGAADRAPAQLVATARVVARFAEAIEQLAGMHPSASDPERRR